MLNNENLVFATIWILRDYFWLYFF